MVCSTHKTKGVLLLKRLVNWSGAGFCDRVQKQCQPPPAISDKGELRSAVFCQVTGIHLMCQIFMNDLLTEQGQERSTVIRYIIDTTQRSPANRKTCLLVNEVLL